MKILLLLLNLLIVVQAFAQEEASREFIEASYLFHGGIGPSYQFKYYRAEGKRATHFGLNYFINPQAPIASFRRAGYATNVLERIGLNYGRDVQLFSKAIESKQINFEPYFFYNLQVHILQRRTYHYWPIDYFDDPSGLTDGFLYEFYDFVNLQGFKGERGLNLEHFIGFGGTIALSENVRFNQMFGAGLGIFTFYPGWCSDGLVCLEFIGPYYRAGLQFSLNEDSKSSNAFPSFSTPGFKNNIEFSFAKNNLGQSYNLDYTPTVNKHGFRLGIKYHQTVSVEREMFEVYRNRGRPNNFSQSFGLNAGYSINPLHNHFKEKSFNPFVFYDLQVSNMPLRINYLQPAGLHLIDPVEHRESMHPYLYKRYWFKLQESLSLESNIGLGARFTLSDKMYLNQMVGSGIGYYDYKWEKQLPFEVSK